MAENESTIIQISTDQGVTWLDYTRCTPEQADDFFRSANVTAPKDGKHFRAKPNFGEARRSHQQQLSHTTLHRTLRATFDLDLLTQEQVDMLEAAVSAQSEACGDYPDVRCSTWITVDEWF